MKKNITVILLLLQFNLFAQNIINSYTVKNSPLYLDSLVSLWDGNSIDDTAVTTGDFVNVWHDYVSGNDATATSTLRPTLYINSSGEREVKFNGSSQYLNAGQPASLQFISGTTTWTLLAVIGEVVPTKGYFFSQRGSSGTSWRAGLYLETPTYYGAVQGNNSDNYASTTAAEGDLILATSSLTDCVVYKNGTQIGTFPGFSNGTAVDVNIGGRSNGGWLYNGSIKLIAVYNKALSTQELNKIEAFFGF